MPRLPDDERPPQKKALDGIHPVPQPEMVKVVRGTPAVPGKTVFETRHNASQSGTRATGSTDGHAFFTVPLGKGWTWKLAVNTTEAERTHWRSTRKFGPRTTKKLKTQLPEAIPPQAPIPKDPMTQTTPLTPDRQPTRDERSAIHDELTKTYDIVGQRYGGNDSDANVAGRLDLPRAWVTDLRTMFFGDFDRNQQSEVKLKALDEATAFAENAMSELLEMAQRAEQLVTGLKAARKKMEG
jgi:hypothetical protein